jgi:uncharacterized protein (DUF952 family)
MIAYKIMLGGELSILKNLGRFEGTAADLDEGFIHLSSPSQIDRVVKKYYSEVVDVYIVAVAIDTLGENIKWEEASNGQIYPHLYGDLELSSVIDYSPIRCRADGSVEIPNFAPVAKL